MQLPLKETGRFHFDTVIIGAGISGLACAQKLLNNTSPTRKHSFVVLEARNRIGGRIGSVTIDGNRLDIGANWIHGTGTDRNPNPILKFVPESRFKELTSSVAFTYWPKDTLNEADVSTQGLQDKPLVIPSKISADLFASLWQLIESLREKAKELPPEDSRDKTMLTAVLENHDFKDAFKSIPERYHGSLAGLTQMLEGMEAAPLNDISAETPKSSPGMSLAEFAINGYDGEQVFLRDGYVSVVNKLASELVAQDHIQLDKNVHQILWERSPIEILTNDGIYTARDVICTIPLGVLQHHMYQDVQEQQKTKSDFFTPELPLDKLQAVTSLGFGTLDKIFMVYQEPWWTKEPFLSIIQKGISEMEGTAAPLEPDGFRGFTNELTGIQITRDGVTTGPYALFIVNLRSLTGFSVLSAFVSCANARRIEAFSDQEAGDIVNRTLISWFGGTAPPEPKHVHVTRWAQDEFSRGSYSHMIAGKSERKHRGAFATPLVNAMGDKVRFAGEHTSLEDFATAHGALLSGWREADALLADRQ